MTVCSFEFFHGYLLFPTIRCYLKYIIATESGSVVLCNCLWMGRHYTDKRGNPQEAKPAWENSNLGFIEAVHQYGNHGNKKCHSTDAP